MKNRIFFKLLAAFLVVIAAAAIIFDVTLGNAWQASLRSEIERNLEQKTLMFADRVEPPEARVRLPISPRRKAKPPAHAPPSSTLRGRFWPTRKPISPTQQTLPSGRSSPPRSPEKSESTNAAPPRISFLYVAAPISGGAVRLAYPLSDVDAVSAQVRDRLALGSALAFVVALFVAAMASAAIAPADWNTSSMLPPISPMATCARACRILLLTKLAAWLALSIKPRVRSSAASPPCAPASASLKLCSTACRTQSSPSVPMALCSGPTSAWIVWPRSARACIRPWWKPFAIPIFSPR